MWVRSYGRIRTTVKRFLSVCGISISDGVRPALQLRFRVNDLSFRSVGPFARHVICMIATTQRNPKFADNSRRCHLPTSSIHMQISDRHFGQFSNVFSIPIESIKSSTLDFWLYRQWKLFIIFCVQNLSTRIETWRKPIHAHDLSRARSAKQLCPKLGDLPKLMCACVLCPWLCVLGALRNWLKEGWTPSKPAPRIDTTASRIVVHWAIPSKCVKCLCVCDCYER